MFDFEQITTLISPIIVIACMTLGYIIKHTFKNKKVNAFIPLICAIVGVAANLWTIGTVDVFLNISAIFCGFTNILNLPTLEDDETIEIPYGALD